MKAYGFLHVKSDTSFIFKILSEQGDLLKAFETKPVRFSSLAGTVGKWCPEGYEFIYLDNPYSHADFLTAVSQYEERWRMKFNGREVKDVFAW